MSDLITVCADQADELAKQDAELATLRARIEKLEDALREIAKHPRGGCIDTPEKMDRDDFIGIARAALAPPAQQEEDND